LYCGGDAADLLGISVADKGSYFSRFTMKLIEITAAGIATAVSGYLVAHLGGYWSAPPPPPAPATVQAAPSVSTVSKSSRAEPAQPATPAASAATDAPEPHAARTTVNATPAPARKHGTAASADTGAAETRSREAEGKARDAESVEAQVRAALAKVDATRPAAVETPSHQFDSPPVSPAAAAQPRPPDAPQSTGAVALAPRAPELAPPPVPQAPVQPEPLSPVEITSRPVAAVDTSAPAAPAAEANAQAEDKGILSTLKNILRPHAGTASAEPPRPPLPVGE
jgi:hypothetical protein